MFCPKRAGYHSGYQNWYPEFDTRQTNIWFDLLFLNFFTTDMFNFYLKKLYSFSRTFYFFIDQLFIRIVFRRKLFQDFCCFCSFFYQMASAKYNCALHKRCPCFFFYSFISVNGEAYLVAGFQGIDFVTGTCSMEIYFPGIAVIEVIDGNRVWISIISIYRKHATSAALQKFFRSIKIHFFFLSSNRSEHCFSLHSQTKFY